jgi:putative addiction module component (TIGR02574 family)
MSELLIELSEKALTLSAAEREQLAEDLLMSLQSEADPEVEAEWDQEIRRRLTEVENGTAKLIPATDVFEEARRIVGR